MILNTKCCLFNIYYNEHLVWSDGCVAQFKSRQTWYHITRYLLHLSHKHYEQVYFNDYEYSSRVVVVVPSFLLFNGYTYQSKTKDSMHLPQGY